LLNLTVFHLLICLACKIYAADTSSSPEPELFTGNTMGTSVSVIADICTFADGLATALMVMGPEKGIPLVNSLENTECLIVVRDGSGRLTDYKSDFWTFP